MASPETWLDKAIGFVSPRTGLRRIRARLAADVLRNYEAASTGRRTSTWGRSPSDVNAVTGPALAELRFRARDLVRNNGYAESALTTIGDHVVGWGIVAKPKKPNKTAADLWDAWAGTTKCDADGRNDMAGLQKLVMRTTVESGECLVRRRFRRPEDGLPIPMQLQILEPDFLDVFKDAALPNGGRISQGVEFDVLGRRVAYWLYPQHPGSTFVGRTGTFGSYRIPASEIRHVFKQTRPGQVRGPTWFAPVLVRFRDFDAFEDATLMRQKIAACMAVFVTDATGDGGPVGTADDTQTPAIDSLEPGMIVNTPPGRSITVADPPQSGDSDFTKTSLRAIATGLGVTYEDLTGDYNGMPFSAARMSRLRHWARVDDWRWRTLIPQFCDPSWAWAMEAAAIAGLIDLTEDLPAAEWTAPPAPMIDPANEGLAHRNNIRGGIRTLSETLRELGYDPKAALEERAADDKMLDELGIILDSDPRMTTQAGLPRDMQQQQPAAEDPAAFPAADPNAPAADDPQKDDPPADGKKKPAVKPPAKASVKTKRIDVLYDSQGRRRSYRVTED